MSRIALLLMTLLLTPGCALLYDYYEYEGPANMTVTATLDENRFMSSTGVLVHVSRPTADCSDYEYLGMRTLANNDMAFPVGELLFLNVAVMKSVVNETTIIRNTTLFKARKGYHYKFDVFYKDDSHGYALYEKPPSANSYRAIDAIPWSVEACRKMM